MKSGLVQENIVNFVECALSLCLPINQIPRKSPVVAWELSISVGERFIAGKTNSKPGHAVVLFLEGSFSRGIGLI